MPSDDEPPVGCSMWLTSICATPMSLTAWTWIPCRAHGGHACRRPALGHRFSFSLSNRLRNRERPVKDRLYGHHGGHDQWKPSFSDGQTPAGGASRGQACDHRPRGHMVAGHDDVAQGSEQHADGGEPRSTSASGPRVC